MLRLKIELFPPLFYVISQRPCKNINFYFLEEKYPINSSSFC